MTTATRPAPIPQAVQQQDTRKRTELDADFARLHAATVKRLTGVLRRFVADLRRSDMADAHAQSVFIHTATQVLQSAYEEGHREGQRDYWQTFSRRRNLPRQIAEPSGERTKRIMGWYAVASLAKMAREGAMAAQAARHSAAALSDAADNDAGPAVKHTGVMIAFFLKRGAAQRLALPGGEPPKDLHITLTFHGDVADLPPNGVDDLKRVVATYAAEAQPLSGTVSGLGRFRAGPHSEGKAPIYATVDVPGLQKWRAGLAQRLEAAGLSADGTFEYTPHITLSYVDEDAPMPVTQVPAVKLTLDRVTLAVGDERFDFPVGAQQLSEMAYTLADGGGDALDDWQSGLDNRVALQASISWVGLQDGYVDAGDLDPAGLPMSVYWILGPAVHCEDCLDLASKSPYDPPWGSAHGNPLTQSPGDGQTACGASCKCDLDYRPDWRRVNEGLVADTWKIWLGSGAGREALGNIGTGLGFGPNEALLPDRIGGPTRAESASTPSGMSDAQLAALDRFRDAWDGWEAVRGELPAAPDLFVEGLPELSGELPAWSELTAEQQRIIGEMIDALWAWVDASGEGLDDAEAEQQFTADDAESIRLSGHPPGYSQARYRNGQWAPGDGGQHEHEGSARGGGAIHGAGAGEVHEAKVGGGGGAHTGGHTRPPAGYEVAREAGQWHARTVDLHGTLHAIPGEHGYGTHGEAVRRAWEIHEAKGRVTVEEERSGTRAQLNAHLGRVFTDEELAGITGAAPGSRVVLERGYMLATHAPDGTVTRVRVQQDDASGKLIIRNHSEERPGGPVTAPRDPEMLLRQATAAQKLGIETIAAKAASLPLRDSETLTRMGYNAPLDVHLLAELRGIGGPTVRSLAPYPPNWSQMHYVSDLMRSAAGREWYFARPHVGTMYFDTNPRGKSMQQLRGYLRHHGRSGEEGGGTTP